jgi:hypothetical protein
MTLFNEVVLTKDIVVPAGKVIKVDLNGFTINKNGYTITGEGIFKNKVNDSTLLGAIRRFLNLEEGINTTKNIIVYEMDDGSSLSSTKEYKLQIKEKGSFIDVDVNEVLDNVGRYNISEKEDNTRMRTINGKIYINNIPNGEYRLVDNTNKEVVFTIDNSGQLIGNVKENYTSNVISNIMSKSKAEIILNIQTGIKVIRYGLILLVLSILLTSIMIIKKKVRD